MTTAAGPDEFRQHPTSPDHRTSSSTHHPSMHSITCESAAETRTAKPSRQRARTAAPCQPLAALLLCLIQLLFFGCAFDVAHVKQLPASFQPVTGTPVRWRLGHEAKVSIGTGYTTRLQPGTRWVQVGRLEQGDVFKTADQIVTVEASNIHEAYLVIKDGAVTGFYLPVERTFTPVNPPKLIQIQTQ